MQLCGRRQIAEPRKYCLVRVIVFLLAFFFSIFLYLSGLKFRLNSQHVQVYDDIWKLIILYPIDLRIIFSKFLLQPGPPKYSFLATPLGINNKLFLLRSPITCSGQQSLILVTIYNFGLVVIWDTGYPSTHNITFKSLDSNNFKEKIKLQ